MKRPSKDQADTDLRGRIRRAPRAEGETLSPINARFIDGPIAGTERLVPRGADYVKVGMWTYSFAGRDGRTPLYSRLPDARIERRALHSLIALHGKDPRLQVAAMKRTPHKRTAPPAKARGQRRRQAARGQAE